MTEDIIQRSSEWYAARCGSLGASQVQDAIARTKTGWGAGRDNLRAALVLERLTGRSADTFQSAAMLHGIETEPEARSAYEFFLDNAVTEVGLVKHPTIAWTHASPDGLVADDGLVEIKCMQPKGHMEILEHEKIPLKYQTQMLWQMACTGRAWCDFVAYQPSFPESMRLGVRRVERDDARITELEALVAEFLTEVEQSAAALRAKYEEAA